METKKDINLENTFTLENFIGVTPESDGHYNLSINKTEFSEFSTGNKLSNKLFEFFILDLMNNRQNNIYKKKDFAVITYDILKSFNNEAMTEDTMRPILQTKNILDKKFIFIPYQFADTSDWCLVIIENIYVNFSQEVIKKIISKNNFNLNEKAKVRVLYYEKNRDVSIKEIKNKILQKFEIFLLTYIGIKYSIKFDRCLNSEKLKYDLFFLKLIDNNKDFSNSVIIIKIIFDILSSQHSIKDFFLKNEITKLNYYLIVDPVIKDLDKIIDYYFSSENINTTESKSINLLQINNNENDENDENEKIDSSIQNCYRSTQQDLQKIKLIDNNYYEMTSEDEFSEPDKLTNLSKSSKIGFSNLKKSKIDILDKLNISNILKNNYEKEAQEEPFYKNNPSYTVASSKDLSTNNKLSRDSILYDKSRASVINYYKNPLKKVNLGKINEKQKNYKNIVNEQRLTITSKSSLKLVIDLNAPKYSETTKSDFNDTSSFIKDKFIIRKTIQTNSDVLKQNMGSTNNKVLVNGSIIPEPQNYELNEAVHVIPSICSGVPVEVLEYSHVSPMKPCRQPQKTDTKNSSMNSLSTNAFDERTVEGSNNTHAPRVSQNRLNEKIKINNVVISEQILDETTISIPNKEENNFKIRNQSNCCSGEDAKCLIF